MNDLISRQKAIDAVLNLSEKVADEMLFIDAIVDEIENIPSAEPERKTGEWVIEEGWDGDEIYQCPFCKAEFVLIDGTPEDNDYEYCPKCGAYLKYVPKPKEEAE